MTTSCAALCANEDAPFPEDRQAGWPRGSHIWERLEEQGGLGMDLSGPNNSQPEFL